MRLLEAEQVLVVRRGIRGGLWARSRTSEGVVHSTTVLLRCRGTNVLDLTESFAVIGTRCIGVKGRARGRRRRPGRKAGAAEERRPMRCEVTYEPPDSLGPDSAAAGPARSLQPMSVSRRALYGSSKRRRPTPAAIRDRPSPALCVLEMCHAVGE
jgi:hypothetical protein